LNEAHSDVINAERQNAELQTAWEGAHAECLLLQESIKASDLEETDRTRLAQEALQQLESECQALRTQLQEAKSEAAKAETLVQIEAATVTENLQFEIDALRLQVAELQQQNISFTESLSDHQENAQLNTAMTAELSASLEVTQASLESLQKENTYLLAQLEDERTFKVPFHWEIEDTPYMHDWIPLGDRASYLLEAAVFNGEELVDPLERETGSTKVPCKAFVNGYKCVDKRDGKIRNIRRLQPLVYYTSLLPGEDPVQFKANGSPIGGGGYPVLSAVISDQDYKYWKAEKWIPAGMPPNS